MNSFVEPSSKLTGKCELRVGRQTADSNSTSSFLWVWAWCQLDSRSQRKRAWRVASPGAGSWELGCLGGIWTWGRERERKAAHQDQPGGRGSLEGCTRACWRWRSLPEPASMLDLDGPLSRRTGERISLCWRNRARSQDGGVGRGGAWDHFTLSDSEGLGSKTQNNGVLDG
jgi:hypothetical protein